MFLTCHGLQSLPGGFLHLSRRIPLCGEHSSSVITVLLSSQFFCQHSSSVINFFCQHSSVINFFCKHSSSVISFFCKHSSSVRKLFCQQVLLSAQFFCQHYELDGQGTGILSSAVVASRPSLGPTQPSVRWMLDTIFQEDKRSLSWSFYLHFPVRLNGVVFDSTVINVALSLPPWL